METKFASAERALKEKIAESFDQLKGSEYIDSIINALPYIGAILNQERQVIFANRSLLKVSGLETIQKVIGKRPGEALHCINAQKELGGCGTSENCKVCGAVNTILECQRTQKEAVGECRITSQVDNEQISFDFKVTTIPITVNGQTYYVYSMVDISNEKRRQILERIFFHDLINKAGSIHSIADIIVELNDETKFKEMISLLADVSKEMLDEIIGQRQLNSAENDELAVNDQHLNSLEVVQSIAEQMKHHMVAKEKVIVTDPECVKFHLVSDEALLKRVLLNMIKNALEASKKGQSVTIGCNIEADQQIFWVHNQTFIPKDTQLQLFQRSFSTKGKDRGIGTYSMKLLGEGYLKGKVGFTSDETEGTMFYIAFPIDFDV